MICCVGRRAIITTIATITAGIDEPVGTDECKKHSFGCPFFCLASRTAAPEREIAAEVRGACRRLDMPTQAAGPLLFDEPM